MMNRREVLQAFAVVAAASCPLCRAAAADFPVGSYNGPGQNQPAPARPRSSRRWNLQGGCGISAAALGDANGPRLARNTGNAFVDSGFARSRTFMVHAFGVSPAFAFLDDSESPNAFATPDNIVGWDRGNGSVVFGVRLLTEEVAADPQTWGSALSLIMAHEWGHIKQFYTTGPLPSPLAELHADFLAGWWLGGFNLMTNGWGINPNSAGRSVFNKGDFEFNSPQHHGTPQQRLTAMAAGYQLSVGSNPNIAQAFQAGLRFLGA